MSIQLKLETIKPSNIDALLKSKVKKIKVLDISGRTDIEIKLMQNLS